MFVAFYFIKKSAYPETEYALQIALYIYFLLHKKARYFLKLYLCVKVKASSTS